MTLKFVDIGRDQARINIAALDCDGVILGVMDGNVVNPFWQQQADQTLACGKLLGLYDFYENDPLEAGAFVDLVLPYVGKAVLLLHAERDHPQLPERAAAWVSAVQSATGCTPPIYTNTSLLNEHDWGVSVATGAGLWLSQYWTMDPQGWGNPAPAPYLYWTGLFMY